MQVESTILAGPHANLTAFLKSLARLEGSTAFLAQHRWACPCRASRSFRPRDNYNIHVNTYCRTAGCLTRPCIVCTLWATGHAAMCVLLTATRPC